MKHSSKKKVALIIILTLSSLTLASENKECKSSIAIAPYLGIDQKALAITSLYNQDLILLQQRQKFVEHIPSIEQHCPPTIFEISGIANGLVKLVNPMTAFSSSAQIDAAELDFASHISNRATLFFDLAYNDQPISTVGQINNSKIILDRIFLTIGDLNHTPFYLTLGRRYVPFGQYHSFTISGSIGQDLGKTKAASILIGYQHPASAGLYVSLYGIKSVKKLFWDGNQKLIPGLTTGYSLTNSSEEIDIGLDYIKSIDAAQGFQSVQAVGNIPGIDIHGKIKIHNITLIAEYTSAIRKFSKNYLTYNNHPAKPAAEYYEAGYEFTTFSKDSSIAVGYGKTHQSVQLKLPSESINVSYNIALSKNFILNTQYQHNISYSFTSLGSGQGRSYTPPAKNIIYLRLLAYF